MPAGRSLPGCGTIDAKLHGLLDPGDRSPVRGRGIVTTGVLRSCVCAAEADEWIGA